MVFKDPTAVPIYLSSSSTKNILDAACKEFEGNIHFTKPHFSRTELLIFYYCYLYLKFVKHKTVLPIPWAKLVFFLWKKGYIKHLYLNSLHACEPYIHYFTIESGYFAEYSDGVAPHISKYSRGFSKNIDEALSVCIGECLERTPALYYRNTDLTKGSYAALKDTSLPVVDPDEINVFGKEQQKLFLQEKDLKNEVFSWAKCTQLCRDGNSKSVLLPAQLVWWNYKRNKEPFLREAGTHGMAGYFTKDGALERAILECVGRDGFFEHWLYQKTPEKILVRDLVDDTLNTLLAEVADKGFRVHFLDVTSSTIPIPSVLCLLTRSDNAIASLAAGHSCGYKITSVLHDALEEALSMFHWLRYNKLKRCPSFANGAYTPFGDVQRLSYWAHQGISAQLSWILEGAPIPLNHFVEKHKKYLEFHHKNQSFIDYITDTYSDDHPIYYYEHTNDTLRRMDFNSVKVIMPTLIPMHHDMRYIPMKILQKSPKDTLNRMPHMFP